MSYEVIARKWRPQQFEAVVGQEHVTRTLHNAIETSRIAHAYLFVGPRGVGKTSVARIFAKALNCRKGPTVTPCEVCDACKEITAGTSLDVMEIDGASNNGVDQVRDLRETVKYAPASCRFKIYIIDEVHMLSNAAFNALLKTLEEPPPHVKFMFATTEAEKVLPTIVSRCQRFDLRRIPLTQIVERLRLVAKDEQVQIDDDALLAIARGAEGGLRDAESALDQLISFRGNRICEDDVLAVFGLAARSSLEQLAGCILRGDLKGILTIIHTLDQAGKDLSRVLVELLGHFRNVLVCRELDAAAAGLDLSEGEAAALKAQGEGVGTERLLRILEILTDGVDKMKFALSRRTLLETGLIRAARAASVVSLADILEQIRQLQAGGAVMQPAAYAAPAPAAAPPASAAPRSSPPPPPELPVMREAPAAPPAQAPAGPAGAAVHPPAPLAPEQAARELSLLNDRWHAIIEQAGRISMMVRDTLRDARPVSVATERVTIGFDPEFAEAIKNMEAVRNRKAIEHALGEVLRRTVTVAYVPGRPAASGPAPEVGSGLSNADTSDAGGEEDAPPERPPATGGEKAREAKSKQEWLKDQVVRTTLDLFDGTLSDIRD